MKMALTTATDAENQTGEMKAASNDKTVRLWDVKTGRCVRVQSQADNLNLLQLAGRVSSLYPVPATPAAPATP